jgi:cytochrome c oxidase assembly protein subunit 15
MTRSSNNPWLHRFAILSTVTTLLLVWIGGLVTSKGVGLSVPDWPTTYGYNMFFFPISKWVGGIFYEHSHRLLASAVGFLTVILAVWLWLKEERPWLRRLGFLALVLVVLQGVLGGLRVTLIKDELGIFHATLAQLFFALLGGISLVTSKWWVNRSNEREIDRMRLHRLYAFTTVLILFQLVLGATMRHQHAGLAIPDFPTAYGKLWPQMDASSIERYNQMRTEVVAVKPITAFQVALQMVHRFTAAIVFILVGLCAVLAQYQFGFGSRLTRMGWLWFGLLLLQVILGAATILTNKSADIATAHVAVGALSLLSGMQLWLAAGRSLKTVALAKRGTMLEKAEGNIVGAQVKFPA